MAFIPTTRRRMLGQSDIEISPMAWGMWRLQGEDAAAARLVHAALDSGLTLLDTADIYGLDNTGFGAAEALLGRVLAAEPGLRRRMVLATKGGICPGIPYDSSDLVAACEASLRRLGTDRIDLYQIHRPDLLAHPHEVAAALERLRASGKIREAGVSNHTPAQTASLAAFLPFPLASTQPELSALAIGAIDDGILDQAMASRMTVLAWSPLGGGRLAGDAADPRGQAVCGALDAIAGRCGVPRAVAAYAWIMAHPASPIPIVGSQSEARIRESVRAVDIGLTRADWYAVFAAARQAALP